MTKGLRSVGRGAGWLEAHGSLLGILVLVVLVVTGCRSWQQEEAFAPDEFLQATALDPDENRIVGVTMADGERVDFDLEAAPAEVRGESIFAVVDGQPVEIALADAERVWIQWHRQDVGRTVLAVVGVAAAVVLVIGLVVAATKESCPFIYAWDGEQWVFDAEPYGGATTKGLERADFTELESLVAVDGEYRIRITNEVNETQYTNFLELWAVHHPAGTRVVAGEFGTVYVLSDPVSLSSAVDAEGRDLRPWLEATDGRVWEHPPVPTSTGQLNQDLILTFPKPEGARSATLIANVATGAWGSHMIREFYEMRGSSLDSFYASIDGSPEARDELLAWNVREELYTLQVRVEEPTGWEVRGLLPGGGPFISEDRAVPLDISRVEGDVVRIRIRPPVGFWGLNSFQMDFGTSQDVQIEVVTPTIARTSEGADVLLELDAVDEAYYAMPQTGDWAELRFPEVRVPEGMEQTFILSTQGYYRLHLEADGEPDLALLDAIENVPGVPVQTAVESYIDTRAGVLGGSGAGAGPLQ